VPAVNARPRPPTQERSRKSQERVLTAARDLMAREGHDAVTMATVARVAGVGIGTIYTRFVDRAGLLRAVQGLQADEMQRECVAGLHRLARTEAPPREVVAGAVRVLVRLFRKHRRAMQQVFQLGTQDAQMQETGAAAAHPAWRRFVDLVMPVVRTPGVAPERAADLIWRTVFEACAYRVTFGVSSASPLPLSWSAFETELVRMTVAYADVAGARRRRS
jgi:AcrR family transcriptional regulator